MQKSTWQHRRDGGRDSLSGKMRLSDLNIKLHSIPVDGTFYSAHSEHRESHLNNELTSRITRFPTDFLRVICIGYPPTVLYMVVRFPPRFTLSQ